jgi:hypothetical protein
MEWWIHIMSYRNDMVKHKIGPFTSARQAEKADTGLNRNLNHDAYYTQVIGPVELSATQPTAAGNG